MDDIANPAGPQVLLPFSEKGIVVRDFVDLYRASFDQGEDPETVFTDIFADLFHLLFNEHGEGRPTDVIDRLVDQATCHFVAETLLDLDI